MNKCLGSENNFIISIRLDMANVNRDNNTLLQANATIIAGLFILISIIAQIKLQPIQIDDYLFTWEYVINGTSENIPPKLK
ncbi:MAG: hypothetical protein KatS3mg003_1605 [Candidatus Nitrosocaldaceae archaeon]|nr:MAG: hypothetical protein KatS3mg003_0462 [Candidatus Nitrosocaldaceae archaeon]GIU72126.1 MAG: hypothetical protein KatS3mg003_1605 [Candidatus Nitrosocaldaceae archaeon]